MPDLSVSLRGRMRSTEGLGTEQVALVELELTPPTKPAAASMGIASSDVESDLETAPGSEVPLDPLERDDSSAAKDELGASRRGRDGPTKRQVLMKDVPYVLSPAFVRQAIDAALSAQGIAAALGRLDSLSSRSRTSAMLPETRLRAGRDIDQSLRLTPTADEPYRYSQSGGVSFVIEGAVTWRLGRLVFASEELSIERLRLAQARERQRCSAATMNELLTWQTAWRRVAAAGDRSSNAADDLAESTLRLDVFTDGWFSAHQPAPDPLDAAKSPVANQPKPTGTPSAEQDGAPSLVPSIRQRRRLPREASQTKHPVPEDRPSEQEDLERLALSR